MHIPDFTLPGFVGRINRYLPQGPNSFAIACALNLAQRAHILPECCELEGKLVSIVVDDLGVSCHIGLEAGRFKAQWRMPQAADVTVRANLADYLRLALREEDPDTLFFNRKLAIEGDTELGLIVKNLLDSIDWDMVPFLKRSAVAGN